MMEGEERSVEISDAAQYEEAVRAMDSGDESAKTKVAFYKLSGRGGAVVDAGGAVALLQAGAKRGDGRAKWMLGLCLQYGLGIEQDVEQAYLLYQQSSEAGVKAGELLLWNGKGGDSTKIRGCL